MDQHGPGISLFTDAGSIHLPPNDIEQQRAEEEEDLRDRQQRKVELEKDLEVAFDDLHGDDTLNSLSHNYSDDDEEGEQRPIPYAGGIYTGRENFSENPPRPNPWPVPADLNPDKVDGGVRELRLLLESKTRELDHLAREMYEKGHAHEQQISELRKKVMIEEAEKDRAIMGRDQTRELLVESKTKISELEDTNDALHAKVKALENRNVSLEAEVEQRNTELQDTLHRYRMLEQNTSEKTSRRTDALLKDCEERHNAKVAMMQQQINNLRSEVDERQQECRRLEARYGELQKSREALLIEKSNTVQRLQEQLEDSQRQCSNLLSMSKNQGDFDQERVRLRSRIGTLEQEQTGMRQTIADLTHRLEKTMAELELMDSVVHAGATDKEHLQEGAHVNGEPTQGKTETHATDVTASYAFAHRNLIGSTPNNNFVQKPRVAFDGDADARVVRLKNELLACMAGQKEKRATIWQLERDLQARDRELDQLKKDESEVLVQMNQYKEEAFRLASKCRILEQEMEKMAKQIDTAATGGGSVENRRSSYALRQESLEDRILTLQKTKSEADERIDRLEKEKANLEEKCRSLSAEVSICAALRLEIEKQKFLLSDAQNECDRLKRLYVDMSATKDEVVRELTTLRSQDSAKQIAALQEKVVSLERVLQLAELKSSELEKLLDKEKTSHETLLQQLSGSGDGVSNSRKNTPTRQEKNLTNSCTKCLDGLSQITKLEIENLKLQSNCANQLREICELRTQLDDQHATITELHHRLDLKAIRDKELDDLKQKATVFDEFMRSQHTKSSAPSPRRVDSSTSPERIVSRDQSVGPDEPVSPVEEDSPSRRQQLREREQQVREEMARAFAGQMKQIEERFRGQFSEFEENMDTVKQELHDRKAELKVRNQEIEVLKCAILTEREKIGELLRQKDAEARALFDKQSELMGKYKAELGNGQRKVQFLERELQEKRELIVSERQSMEKLMAQIATERTTHREREREMIDKCTELETEYHKSLELVTEKYQSAKKTALNYKKYAEDKEQHMLKEYDRIKEGYNTALIKVQNRMKEALDSKEKTLREKIYKLEAEYESKLAHRTEHA
ncbi:centrosomal protein of 152 kDa [Anopheles bellator]|uniref:centrosomal protein of 152 kDa n=1 Tax=Anopheles bellator TaxID=139047 RepID=UPI00264831BD|nr:centrosomal protein of 152 kDa [Anopheles bellator]